MTDRQSLVALVLKIIIILAACAVLAIPHLSLAQQPTPAEQVALLQAELQATREQRDAAHNQVASIIASARAQIAALTKELEAAKKAEAKK